MILKAYSRYFSWLSSFSLACIGHSVEQTPKIKKSSFFKVRSYPSLLLGGVICSFLVGLEGVAAQIPIAPGGGINEVIRTCSPSLAEAYLDSHKWKEAHDCYLEIVKREPSSAIAWSGLATSLIYMGHREEALKDLCDAVSRVRLSQRSQLLTRIRVLSRLFLTNATFQTFQDGSILLSGKKFKLAQEKFEKALSDEPDNVGVLIKMGQSQFLDGSPKDAIHYLKIAKQLDPFESEAQLWLGKSLQTLGNSREALIELKEAYYSLKNDTNSEVATVWYSEALISLGQMGVASRILNQDVRANPLHFHSLMAAARLRAQTIRLDSINSNSTQKEFHQILKRLERVKSSDFLRSSQTQDNLAFIQDKNLEQMRAEIQVYLKQLDRRS